MKITIYAPDFNLSPDINDYLEKKISRLEKFVPSSDRGKNQPEPETRIKIERESARGNLYKIGAELVLVRQVISVSAQNHDVFQAIDDIKDKLQRELKSYSGKKETIYRRAMRKFKSMSAWPGEFRSKHKKGHKKWYVSQ